VGDGLNRPAFRLDDLTEKLAAEMHLGRPAQILGGLVEVARRQVQPAGQLTHAQTQAIFGVVQPGIERVRTADAGRGIAPA
jgi:hypothetical protein